MGLLLTLTAILRLISLDVAGNCNLRSFINTLTLGLAGRCMLYLFKTFSITQGNISIDLRGYFVAAQLATCKMRTTSKVRYGGNQALKAISQNSTSSFAT